MNYAILLVTLVVHLGICAGLAYLADAQLHEVVAFAALAFTLINNMNVRTIVSAIKDAGKP